MASPKKQRTPRPKKGKVGRPARPMPEPIPDTPENVMRAIVNTPPKKAHEWEYMRKAKSG